MGRRGARKPEPGPTHREVPVSKEQIAKLIELDAAVGYATERRALYFDSILDGHGLGGRNVLRMDTKNLVLHISEG